LVKTIEYNYCRFRGFRIVGPFVVMIYKMIHTDLLRFFAIYLVFLIGFSQGISYSCCSLTFIVLNSTTFQTFYCLLVVFM